MASAPLVPNEAPPAYTAPPPGFKNDGARGYPAGSAQGYQSGAPPPGYQSGAPAGYGGPPGYPAGYQQPSYMAGQAPPPGVIVVQNHPNQSQPPVVIVGGCPACRVGVLEDDFSCLGVLCAILFFPIGILCCLAMRQRHCPNCGAVFG